jgi:hypothetical protein
LHVTHHINGQITYIALWAALALAENSDNECTFT